MHLGSGAPQLAKAGLIQVTRVWQRQCQLLPQHLPTSSLLALGLRQLHANKHATVQSVYLADQLLSLHGSSSMPGTRLGWTSCAISCAHRHMLVLRIAQQQSRCQDRQLATTWLRREVS